MSLCAHLALKKLHDLKIGSTIYDGPTDGFTSVVNTITFAN